MNDKNRNSLPRISEGKILAVGLTTAALILALGCHRESAEGGSDDREVRGEPIVSTNGTSAARDEIRAGQGISEVNPSTSLATNAPAVASPDALASPTTLALQTGTSPEEKIGAHLVVGFDKLASFKFKMPDDLLKTNQIGWIKSDDQIPKEIKALDERQVALKGYMLPLRVERGLVTELLIMRDQSMCCYGTVPRINEWVSVKMTNAGIKPIMDQPVTLFGKLHVGEMRENGYLVGIYAMDGEKMAGPQGF